MLVYITTIFFIVHAQYALCYKSRAYPPQLELVLSDLPGQYFIQTTCKKHVSACEQNSLQLAECVTHCTVVAFATLGIRQHNVMPCITYQGQLTDNPTIDDVPMKNGQWMVG